MTASALLLLTIVIVAALTAAATSVRFVSRIWLRHWVEQRMRGARTAELYLERPQRLLLAATTGVAVTVFFAGTVIGETVEGGVFGRARAILVYALALLLLGQLVPRAIARRWATTLVPFLLPVLRAVGLVLTPVLATARRLTGETRRDESEGEETEAEALEELLREGEMEGVGESAEIAIIEGVMKFGGKTLGEVMTSRREVFALPEGLPSAELARQIAAAGYSRVPLYRSSLDEIVGMLHAFDVLQEEEVTGESPKLRPVAFATPDMPCNDSLFRMIRERRHLAVVRGEDGATLGIVTLEDLLEELVGDIRDEHDEPSPPAA